MVKRCKRCVQTDTRPGIKFNEEGICYPCISHEKREQIDWNARWNELKQTCNLFRKNDGSYDCLITVSGGKDSTAQVGLFKEKLRMNPLCFMIDNGSWTKTGRENFYNLSKEFDVDVMTFTPSVKKMEEMTRKNFFEELWPSKYWDSLLYKKPLEIAKKLGIDFVIWGEDTSYFTGGGEWKETADALKLVDAKTRITYQKLNVIFLSYYIPWSRYENLEYAKKHGFKTLEDTKEWKRSGMEGFEFEQVDTIGYLINQYCKFVKFGFSTQTELCSDAIRNGKISREIGMMMVNKYDWKLDEIMLDDFCKSIKITRFDFFETIKKFINEEVLEIRGENLRLKKDAV
ncbi:MAG: N-acetyl sugar amidotransferase [Candidatus Peregrinibacteria bacterium]|nr:N-acetyl sugar amidotransferase [Candidatus Peregrinibacteria bacterium]